MYSAATEVTNAFLSVATAPFDRQGRLWDHILDAASFDMQRGCVHEGLPTSETRSTGLDARAALNDVCELPRLLCWAALALDTCLR